MKTIFDSQLVMLNQNTADWWLPKQREVQTVPLGRGSIDIVIDPAPPNDEIRFVSYGKVVIVKVRRA